MTLHDTQDRITRQIELTAPRARVWKALTDHREFSAWFGVDLEGPFTAGQTTRGQINIPGYEHIRLEATVQKIQPEDYFSYTWHPYAVDPNVDYSAEPSTLVEFFLEDRGERTLLTVVESGFANLPDHRRDEAFRMNDHGWAEQLKSIEEHVTQS